MPAVTSDLRIDVAIVGGGVTGLWMLNRLNALGYDVALFERDALGAGQSIYSQGMIHGSQRYVLDGQMTRHAELMRHMPSVWRACLEGHGQLDLSAVHLLSREQHILCSDRMDATAFSSTFGARPMARAAWPRGLAEAVPTSTSLFCFDNAVVDCSSLLHTLAKPCAHLTNRGAVVGGARSSRGLDHILVAAPDGRLFRVQAKRFVFAAGLGNELAAMLLGIKGITQRRALRQLLVRPLPFPLFLHCMTSDPRPRLTITAHAHGDGYTWYLGGLVASTGLADPPRDAIASAARELADLFPNLLHSRLEWASVQVERAEVFDDGGHLPGTHALRRYGNVTLAWPTKMTLTPALAAEFLEDFPAQPVGAPPCRLPFPRPEFHRPPWETAVFTRLNSDAPCY